MLQSIFILSLCGEVLIERHLRSGLGSDSSSNNNRASCDGFWSKYQKQQQDIKSNANANASMLSSLSSADGGCAADVPPVTTTEDGTIVISVNRGSLLFLGCTMRECPPLLVIEFLHSVASVFENYFGKPISPDLIKENFTTVYQLLEEMNDNGYPLTTEPNSLEAMIKKPTVLGKIQQAVTGASNVSSSLPDGTVSNMPWRRSSVRYAQNEIYVDLVEEIDAIIDVNGQVVSSDINGSIQCQSKLSGVPDLCLTFRDPHVIDDCSFHPCVRYNRYDRDKVISFVPPDGAFELMRYRVKNMSQLITPPIFCTPQLSFGGGQSSSANPSKPKEGRISVLVGLKASSSLVFPGKKGPMVLEDVTVTIPFPMVVRTANLTANMGTVLYDEATKVRRNFHFVLFCFVLFCFVIYC